MNDFIEALKEIKKESKDFKITLAKKEVLEITKEFDRLNNIINEIKKLCKENYVEGHDDDGYSDAWFDWVYVREIKEIIGEEKC